MVISSLQVQAAAVMAGTYSSLLDACTTQWTADEGKSRTSCCMQVKGKDSRHVSDAVLKPQRKDTTQVAWAGHAPSMLDGLLDRPTSCPPGARSPEARPCSPRVGGPKGSLPRTGSLAGHVGALTLQGKRPSPELVSPLHVSSDAFQVSKRACMAPFAQSPRHAEVCIQP